MTRLQARISSLERAADLQHLYRHTESSSSSHSPPSSPKKPHTTLPSSKHSTHLRSPTQTRTCSSPPAHTYLHTSHPHLPTWLQSSSIDSSLDLPLSLKATLREALSKHPWESSSSSPSLSISSFPDTVDHSWQGLNTTEATVTSDLSFNPLTYMADKRDDGHMEATSMQEGDEEQTSESRRESVCTLVGQQEEQLDMSSLTGMLRFVNQTLAMQEDPSLWSSTGLSQTLQVTTPPLSDIGNDYTFIVNLKLLW